MKFRGGHARAERQKIAVVRSEGRPNLLVGVFSRGGGLFRGVYWSAVGLDEVSVPGEVALEAVFDM